MQTCQRVNPLKRSSSFNTFALEHKHTFSEGEPPVVVHHWFAADHLLDVVNELEAFLKGCGFIFNGRLGIIGCRCPENHVEREDLCLATLPN